MNCASFVYTWLSPAQLLLILALLPILALARGLIDSATPWLAAGTENRDPIGPHLDLGSPRVTIRGI